jgi:ATP-binding protein involved in chromosome partitioning
MFGIAFLGEIPLVLSVREGGDNGRPVVVASPNSPEAQAFLTMAKNIAGRVSTEAARPVAVASAG